MKTRKRPLPIPQHEFGFTQNTFALYSEAGIDGFRVARERAEAEEARRIAEQAQAPLFPITEARHE